MPIRFSCPHCGKSLKVPDEHAGKAGRCPQCRQRVEIPEAADDAGASSPAVPPPQPPSPPAEPPAAGEKPARPSVSPPRPSRPAPVRPSQPPAESSGAPSPVPPHQAEPRPARPTAPVRADRQPASSPLPVPQPVAPRPESATPPRQAAPTAPPTAEAVGAHPKPSRRKGSVTGMVTLLILGASLIVFLPMIWTMAWAAGEDITTDPRTGQRTAEGLDPQRLAILGKIALGGAIAGGLLWGAWFVLHLRWVARLVRDLHAVLGERAELPGVGVSVALLCVPVLSPVWTAILLGKIAGRARTLYFELMEGHRVVINPGNPTPLLMVFAALALVHLPVAGLMFLLMSEDPTVGGMASVLIFLPLVAWAVLEGIGVVITQKCVNFAFAQLR